MVSDVRLDIEPSVILYGGAFDPPHVGHRLVVQRAAQLFPRSRIWISTSPSPAGAAQQHKTPGASYQQRLAMCQLNFAGDIAGGRVELSAIEAQLPPPHYTIRTLQYCLLHYQQDRFALLIGLDQLEQFASWQDPKGILALADLIVVSRNHDKPLADVLRLLGQKLGLGLEEVAPNKMRWQNLNRFIYLLPGCVSDAASRDVRNDPNLALKMGWLAPEVADYMQLHGIYTK